MAIYKVSARKTIQFGGTQADARAIKAELVASGVKKNEIDIDEQEIPRAKGDLISYLNNLVKEVTELNG